MTTEVQETEQKYDAAPGMVLPSLDGLPQVATVSGAEAETLTAEYSTPWTTGCSGQESRCGDGRAAPMRDGI